MGNQIFNFYMQADEIGGIKARTRLSVITKIGSYQAKSMPDSPENLKIFEEAMQNLKKEFAGQSIFSAPSSSAVAPPSVEGPDATLKKLRKYMSVFNDLTAQRSLYQGNIENTYKRVTESIVEAINVARVSIWHYDESKVQIEALDLFLQANGEHSSGTVLSGKDYPGYFKAVAEERTIAAHDAHTDPRTREFSAGYLTPLGITSLLDVPIWVNNRIMGVICHEHIGPKRTWTRDEENFGYLMANIVAMGIEYTNKK